MIKNTKNSFQNHTVSKSRFSLDAGEHFPVGMLILLVFYVL